MSAFIEFMKGLGSELKGFANEVAPGLVTQGASTLANFAMMKEQNKFNAEQAQLTRDYNLDMDSNKYQRTVADMQAAGVNPALALSGPVSTQASSNAQANASATPFVDPSAVIAMAANMKQAKAAEIQANANKTVAEADARNKDMDTKLKEKNLNWIDRLNQLEADSRQSVIELNDKKKAEIDKNIEKAQHEIELIDKQAETEETKQAAHLASAMLDKANAQQIAALTPYLQFLYAAEAENNRAQASIAFAEAAIKQGLIDGGYIDQLIRQAGYEADSAEANAIREWADNAKRGQGPNEYQGQEYYDSKFGKNIISSLWQTADLLGTVLNINLSRSSSTSNSNSNVNSTSTSNVTSTSTSNVTSNSRSYSESKSSVQSMSEGHNYNYSGNANSAKRLPRR